MRKRTQAVLARAPELWMRPVRAFSLAGALVVSSVTLSGIWHGASVPDAQAAPAMQASIELVEVEESAGQSTASAHEPTAAPAPAAAPQATEPAWTRVPKPKMPDGPRRVGIQAGHWLTEQAPPELGRILQQTGASWNGINERDLNVAIAERIAAILGDQGIVVDVLPTTIPPGYLADAFVSLHGDSDGEGAKSGFKLAHSSRRTPHEDALQKLITEEYAGATGLAYDTAGITRNMINYYAHAWTRIRYSTSPFTPSVILEMGFVSNRHDRNLLIYEQDLVAEAVAAGITRFLDANPRAALFGQDLLVPPPPARRTPAPR